ncbi:uncharacterized protein LOC115881059 [Sitophilus oryzae]|uniref:Uncharacterized protein LOC115881059 n=1 Tax=Sitophilus oryzae TaxID=7048 RepID=A0A6J2XS00_SITOR|nr:uncharacterized protein LOC115881059 [Sitophilus oryzae]
MDQNRSDNSASNQQQQNVHLHMHHVCNCQAAGLYPAAYYPAAAAATAVGFRTPLPSLVPYHAAPSSVARPYLQHYQYTQFNVGGQYAVPIASATANSVYGSASGGGTSAIDLVYGSTGGVSNGGGVASVGVKERRDREESGGDSERANEPPEGYDYGQVTPPANELLLNDTTDATIQENFVKFLERSCLTAEQIAYRNRNRPCFRNIQNLCIRTRSEILKPCTTISNIHSQGIPWATKDFIYAFVRLTNCWHILKGYWENRDGSSLGKIEKELTPEFRACYVRWEKETIELAGQLTRIFYNLDTNLNTVSSGASIYSANNLIPPQINLIKSASEGAIKKQATVGEASATSIQSSLVNGNCASSKGVRGILHLPQTGSPSAETADQANQTYATDFCGKDDEFDSEEERTRRVYMKPGSYSVPKKGLESTNGVPGASPRGIEFLETAQNVNKAREVANERYWANVHVGSSKKQQQTQQEFKSTQEEEEKRQEMVEIELNLSTHLNVHEWLISSNFDEFGEPKSPMTTQQELKSFYLDSTYDIPSLDSTMSSDVKGSQGGSITVLQRTKCSPPQQSKLGSSTNGRSFRKQRSSTTTTTANVSETGLRRVQNPYEVKGGGLTEGGQRVLETIVEKLKGHVLRPVAVEGEMDLEKVLQRIKNMEYFYVNEVVRDLRYIIKLWDEIDIHNAGWFSQKLDILLEENLGQYDFNDIKGDANEQVGTLKASNSAIFNNDCDRFI